MKYRIKRTSDRWGEKQPCKDAYKDAYKDGVQAWAIVKYSFWGLIESWTMWASASIGVAQAEKMRMELEIKQNKK